LKYRFDCRRRLLVVHLNGLSRDDFAHALGTFPLVLKETDAGRAKRGTMLAVYDEFATDSADWPRV